MTIEELKDEFARYLYIDSVDYYSKEPLTERKLLQIWLDCAEPREKKIEKLEKENEQLKQENEKLKQLIDIAKITIKMIENTEDTFEKAFCLKKLKELLGDTNDKI